MIIKTNTTLKNVLLSIFYILTLIYQYFDMHNSRNVLWKFSNEGLNRFSVHLTLFLMIISAGLFFLLTYSHKLINIPLIQILISLFLWSTLRDLFSNSDLWLILIHSGLSLMWIFMFNIGYILGICEDKYAKIALNIFISFSFCIVVYAFKMSYNYRAITVGTPGVFNLAYSLLVYIPFFLMNFKNNIYKLFFIVTGILVLISMKRGAIICYPLMALCFFIYSDRKSLSKTHKKIFLFLFITICFILCGYIINSKFDRTLLQRFSFSELQYGSGRSIQYSNAIKLWLNFSVFYKIFGAGTSTFIKDLGIAIHNEILAWLCYYGFIGIFLFFIFLKTFYKKQKDLFKFKSQNFSSHLAIFIYIIVTSLVSGFYFMHMTLFLFLVLGLIYGKEELRINSNTIKFMRESNNY